MQNRNRILFFHFTVLTSVLFFLSNCAKDDNRKTDNPTNGKTTAVFKPGLPYGKMTDQEGNTYRTIVIGTQTWMAENLRTTRYRNGQDITEKKDNSDWANLKTGVYCNPVRIDSIEIVATYGRLYNWYAVSDSRNLAPKGWHVCTDEDLDVLIAYLGGLHVAGSKLKETGTLHWSLSIDATNETGFTAIPAGYINPASYVNPTDFFAIGYTLYGYFWSASEYNIDESSEWALYYNGGSIGLFHNPKEFGCAVRCVKD
jgi:uncharacterized protein (TIGR02145 family)